MSMAIRVHRRHRYVVLLAFENLVDAASSLVGTITAGYGADGDCGFSVNEQASSGRPTETSTTGWVEVVGGRL